MFGEMVYLLNGNIHTLRPGEDKRYTGEYLNIQFNSTCGIGCSPTTPPQSLQPGKRYQFKSYSPTSEIQLVDFPK